MASPPRWTGRAARRLGTYAHRPPGCRPPDRRQPGRHRRGARRQGGARSRGRTLAGLPHRLLPVPADGAGTSRAHDGTRDHRASPAWSWRARPVPPRRRGALPGVADEVACQPVDRRTARRGAPLVHFLAARTPEDDGASRADPYRGPGRRYSAERGLDGLRGSAPAGGPGRRPGHRGSRPPGRGRGRRFPTADAAARRVTGGWRGFRVVFRRRRFGRTDRGPGHRRGGPAVRRTPGGLSRSAPTRAASAGLRRPAPVRRSARPPDPPCGCGGRRRPKPR